MRRRYKQLCWPPPSGLGSAKGDGDGSPVGWKKWWCNRRTARLESHGSELRGSVARVPDLVKAPLCFTKIRKVLSKNAACRFRPNTDQMFRLNLDHLAVG